MLLNIDILVQVLAVIGISKSCLREYGGTTNVLGIYGMEHGKFASGMKLTNIIWMIFGMHTFVSSYFYKIHYSNLHNV